MDHDVLVLADPDAIAEAAIEILVAAAEAAIEDHGRFVLGVSAEAVSESLLHLLATPDHRDRIAWDRTWIVPTDARCDGPGGNRRHAPDWTDFVPIPADHVLRIDTGQAQASRAAHFHEQRIRDLFPDRDLPAFDLAVLGVGAEGETAALYPETDALGVDDRWVTANYLSDRNAWHVTLTLPALCAADQILFLVTGASGADAVADAFGEHPAVRDLPARGIVPHDGSRLVLVDEAAATSLGEPA